MVLGAVALYNRQLPISEGGQKYRLFAKTGLPVRAGQESTLSVSGRVAVSWGNGRYPWTSTLKIPACSSEEGARWFAYPGGFTLDEPQCVTLVVKTGGQEQTVPVPVGTTCP